MAEPSSGGGVGSSRFAGFSNLPLGPENSRESNASGGQQQQHQQQLVPSTAAATTTSSTTTTTTGFGRKRSRESSPVPPDSMLQSAIASAAQTFSNIGYFGLSSLLTQASSSPATATSDNLLNNVLRVDQVRQAAIKACTEQPPWIHWNRSDMASTTLRVTGPHRLGLAQSALRGYRMARASVGCSHGCYYYECWILPGPSTAEILANLPSNARLGPGLQKNLQAALEYEQQQQEREKSAASQQAQTILNNTNQEDDVKRNSKRKQLLEERPPPPAVGGHVRVGWSMRTGDLQAPVGYDKWSYGIRDVGGSIIHQSQRQDHWGGEGFGPGDVVGCAVCLDPVDPSENHIRFFKNGDCMGDFVIAKGKRSGGEAFTDVVSGTYYPACSSYMGGTIRANFGPKFVNPPRKLPPGLKLLPMSELCNAPLDYDAAMAQLGVTMKLFRKAEHVRALEEAIRVEAHILTETYDNYMKQHYDDVRRARLERGLTVQDLPEEETSTG